MVGRSEDSALVAVLGVTTKEVLHLLSNLQGLSGGGRVTDLGSLSQLLTTFLHVLYFSPYDSNTV